MGFSRLSKRRLDELMGRDKKIQKTEHADTLNKDKKKLRQHASSSGITTEDSTWNNQQEVSDNRVSDNRMFEIVNKNQKDSEHGVEGHIHEYLCTAPLSDEIIFPQSGDGNLPNDSNHEDNPSKDINNSDDTVEQDDKGKSNIPLLSSDNLLACLMTCGSQKVNENMYLVVRHLLNSKTCRVCDLSLIHI